MAEITETLQEYEELFSHRFSSDDPEFQEYVKRPADAPPLVEDWRGRAGGNQRGRDRYQDRRGGGGRGWGGGGGGRGWGGDRDRDRGWRGDRDRDRDQHHDRDRDRYRGHGSGYQSGYNSHYQRPHYDRY